MKEINLNIQLLTDVDECYIVLNKDGSVKVFKEKNEGFDDPLYRRSIASDGEIIEEWCQYDENGSLIYLTKNDHGKYEAWHKDGHIMRTIWPGGIEKLFEYDEKGNRIHFKEINNGTVVKDEYYEE